MTTTYTALDAAKLVDTVEQLERRIHERFPNSGLSGVARQFMAIAHQTRERTEAVARPLLWVRLLIVILVLGLLALLVGSLLLVDPAVGEVTLPEYLQVLESLINDSIFVGAGIFFLLQLENRVKRHRSLQALHELRSLAHVVDMHQLTKDPERLSPDRIVTPSSPASKLTPYELGRYLDYCSEMLSLIGKVAALYVQNFDDPVVLSLVNEIESLTTGLSRKIWQKLMILYAVFPAATIPQSRQPQNRR
jgi:hypothetical protein